jgi:hypothetical protein
MVERMKQNVVTWLLGTFSSLLSVGFMAYLYRNIAIAPELITLILFANVVIYSLTVSQVSQIMGMLGKMHKGEDISASVALLSGGSLVLIAIASIIVTIYLMYKMFFISPTITVIYLIIYIIQLIIMCLKSE